MTQIIIQPVTEIDYELKPEDFALSNWSPEQFGKISGGRGGSCRIRLAQTDCVLRHYLRGGLMANLLTDRYLWLGQGNSRPQREVLALQEAVKVELPVPLVIGYRLDVSGLFYRAAIISRYIPNIGTLGEVLRTQSLSENDWISLGRLIRQMHDAGINHADLNANNILIDDLDDFHLIDFDKAKINQSSGPWQRANLERLKRSLEKLQRLQGGFCFDDSQWQALVGGYRG
jgi:3-deoxy-D-manno-octulosonic acid kinase